jgi:hypothetical protein
VLARVVGRWSGMVTHQTCDDACEQGGDDVWRHGDIDSGHVKAYALI